MIIHFSLDEKDNVDSLLFKTERPDDIALLSLIRRAYETPNSYIRLQFGDESHEYTFSERGGSVVATPAVEKTKKSPAVSDAARGSMLAVHLRLADLMDSDDFEGVNRLLESTDPEKMPSEVALAYLMGTAMLPIGKVPAREAYRKRLRDVYAARHGLAEAVSTIDTLSYNENDV